MRTKILTSLVLLTLLAFTLVTPALAFENRSGDKILIGADQVVQDDLYLFADEAVIDGTIQGDLIFFGRALTLNGTVEGDLMAAGQAIVINAIVRDDVRVGGAAMLVGERASIGDDLLFGGASLETKPGSKIGGDLALGAAQVLAAGEVAGSLMAGTGGLELRGTVGGDVKAYVDNPEEGGPPVGMYLQQIPFAVPTVPAGLTIASDARIGGQLEYTASQDLPIPAGVVAGKITRITPQLPEQVKERTPAQKVGQWFLALLRRMITLVLIGLLLVWLLPAFVPNLSQKVRSQIWPSLGWGMVAYAVFFIILLVVVMVTVLLAMLLGLLTLDGLSTAVVFLGILALFSLILGFVLITSYLVLVVAGQLLGQEVFHIFKPDLAENRIWPLVVGVIAVSILVSLPFVGWLFKLLIVFFGLGALWLWGRELQSRQTA